MNKVRAMVAQGRRFRAALEVLFGASCEIHTNGHSVSGILAQGLLKPRTCVVPIENPPLALVRPGRDSSSHNPSGNPAVIALMDLTDGTRQKIAELAEKYGTPYRIRIYRKGEPALEFKSQLPPIANPQNSGIGKEGYRGSVGIDFASTENAFRYY